MSVQYMITSGPRKCSVDPQLPRVIFTVCSHRHVGSPGSPHKGVWYVSVSEHPTVQTDVQSSVLASILGSRICKTSRD